MARDWFNSNNNQGNVLKCVRHNVTATASVTMDGNINVIEAIIGAVATITGVNGSSIKGDKCTIIATNTTGGALNLTLAGTFPAGAISVPANGSAQVELVFNGTTWTAPATIS